VINKSIRPKYKLSQFKIIVNKNMPDYVNAPLRSGNNGEKAKELIKKYGLPGISPHGQTGRDKPKPE
jgi:hypothetical protein